MRHTYQFNIIKSLKIICEIADLRHFLATLTIADNIGFLYLVFGILPNYISRI